MKIRHATLARNLASILKTGLLCCKSKGRLKVVWLHSLNKSSWATLHTVKRHGGRVEQVVVLELNVPRRWLRRSRKGLGTASTTYPPTAFAASWRSRRSRGHRSHETASVGAAHPGRLSIRKFPFRHLASVARLV